jgi:hypothetical protein
MVAYGGRDDGLFRGAILQSGGAFPLSYPNTTAYQKTFDGLITKTECSSLADALAEAQLECIRRLPIDVYRASVGSSTGQSIDGGFTPTSIQFAFPAGKYVKVATMVGGKRELPFAENTCCLVLMSTASKHGRGHDLGSHQHQYRGPTQRPAVSGLLPP